MIYFIQGALTKLIKIGYSRQPSVRIKDMQVGSPDKLVLLMITEGSIAYEQDLHKKFASECKHGEWFEPSPDLLDFIARQEMAIECKGSPPIASHPYSKYEIENIKLGLAPIVQDTEYTGPLTSLL